MRKYSLTLLLFFSAFIMPAYADDRTITVSSQAEEKAAADMIYLTFAVSKQSVEQQQAKNNVDDISSRAIRAAIEQGIDEQDIDSSQLRISPRSRWQNNQRIDDGYQAERTITVTLRNLDKFNPLLNALVGAGIDKLNSIQPALSNEAEVQNRALKAALANASAKAELIAEQFGGKLGKPREIIEQGSSAPMPMRMAAMEMDSKQSANYDFQPGPLTFNAQVTVEFDLKM